MLATTCKKFGRGRERSRKETEVRTIKFNMPGYSMLQNNLARALMRPYNCFYHDGGRQEIRTKPITLPT